jgi:carboxyl-terminal processing protease
MKGLNGYADDFQDAGVMSEDEVPGAGAEADGNTEEYDDQPVMRVRSLKRFGFFFFMLGIVFTLLVIFIYLSFSGGGRIISSRKYDEYRTLEKKFGKYSQIEQIISEKGYYSLDGSGIDSKISSDIIGATGDKYAQYFSASEYSRFSRKYIGSYTGIGIATRQDGDKVVVSRVISGSPAASAGIRKGDIIEKVDGKKVSDIEDASDRITGRAGSRVSVTVRRADKLKNFKIYRQPVEDRSVTYRKYGRGVGYIRIYSFRDGTADDFRDAVESLQADGINRIVIDLRGNSGGVTDESVECADMLLPACRIMSTKDNKGRKKVYKSDASTLGAECAVVVDGETASAAEIFASAVKENTDWPVVGSKTYGKGLIQTVFRLKDGSVIKITTAEYFGADGKKIDGSGIEPDVSVTSGDPVRKAASLLS